MEVESEYGEGKEKEVPPLPLPRCAWIDMGFSNARNTLANKNNSTHWSLFFALCGGIIYYSMLAR